MTRNIESLAATAAMSELPAGMSVSSAKGCYETAPQGLIPFFHQPNVDTGIHHVGRVCMSICL